MFSVSVSKVRLLIFFLGVLSVYFFGFYSAINKFYPYDVIRSIKNNYISVNYSVSYKNKRDLFSLYKTCNADIVMIGDSNTAGINWSEIFNNIDIVNRAIDGEDTSGVLTRLDEIISLTPKKVYISIGINDIRKDLKVTTVFNNYKKILNILLENKIYPIVQSTLLTDNTEYNKKVHTLNNLLIQFSNEHHIKYIDINKGLVENNSINPKFTYDGIHLNLEGYKIWINNLTPHMK